jgi:hypothetical protein
LKRLTSDDDGNLAPFWRAEHAPLELLDDESPCDRRFLDADELR